ncbi:AGD9 [Symbiodinium natans]|uniref:AGD9 protein n=1 Tax=Symbiodinium natans TaxID=878477 RepID=A0A812JXF6_9DINO|nr:AGD9 [Symbiodinium natans]
MKSENRSCFECPNRNPTWISLTYGIYLCLECSGEHRRKGVHISFVRSVELDGFTPEQMVQMAAGGNGKAQDYFKGHEMGKLSGSGRPVDYTSKVAQRYKAQLDYDAKKFCEKFSVVGKNASQASNKESAVDPVDQATDFSFEAPDVKALRGDMGRPVLEKRLLRHGGTHEALKKEYRGRIWGRYGSLDFPCVISFENMSSTSPAMQETPRFT